MLESAHQYALLFFALFIWVLGFRHTGRFVRPKWKIPGKLLFYMLVSYLLIYWFYYYSLIFILGHPLLGLLFHIRVCKKHKINWLNCQPRDRYLQLQEKWARGDFK